MWYELMIKGTMAEVSEAISRWVCVGPKGGTFQAHAIPNTIAPLVKFTLYTDAPKQLEESLNDWFSATVDGKTPPFPVGTLLWWRRKDVSTPSVEGRRAADQSG